MLSMGHCTYTCTSTYTHWHLLTHEYTHMYTHTMKKVHRGGGLGIEQCLSVKTAQQERKRILYTQYPEETCWRASLQAEPWRMTMCHCKVLWSH